jgi:hypothetical protein
LPLLPWNINNPNPHLSKLLGETTSNLNDFKMIEAMGIKIV